MVITTCTVGLQGSVGSQGVLGGEREQRGGLHEKIYIIMRLSRNTLLALPSLQDYIHTQYSKERWASDCLSITAHHKKREVQITETNGALALGLAVFRLLWHSARRQSPRDPPRP